MDLRSRTVIAIAEDLEHASLISGQQLQEIVDLEKNPDADLSGFIIDKNYLTEAELVQKIAQKAGYPFVSLAELNVEGDILKKVSASQASRWCIFPISESKGRLTLAIPDPFDLDRLDEERHELGYEIDYVLAPKSEIEEEILKKYGNTFHGKSSIRQLRAEIPKPARNAGQTVAIVDRMFQTAIDKRASDIHLVPIREGLKVRFRIDGVLEPYDTFPLELQTTILSRIKILGGMDVTEQRSAQDGRTTLNINHANVDIRIATYPTIFGEAAAIRVLQKENLITLDDLGFTGNDREVFERLIKSPYGIFLVTGPTGSGKTTTLYAALLKIDRQALHVLSIEDPVENEIEGVDQMQINARAGVTFPNALRSMLRQDPDVIMVGEIRDQETADIALRAAMTGHLVLSTLHTNSAISAISRLVDLGIENFLVSATILGVLAQRLVRRICPQCKQETPLSQVDIRALGPKATGIRAYKGAGCEACEQKGFKGRIGLYELVEVDEEFRALINSRALEVRLREKATEKGFRTLLEDGIEKINLGITTVDEVLKVCGGGKS